MSISAAELLVYTRAVGAVDTELALAAIGVAVAAAGVASVKMAGDFQSSVTKLYTTAGEAHSNLKMVGDGILNMSSQVGTGAQQLVQAMYWIESGGLHGKQGLDALRVAAEAAKAENADLDKVSIALAASLKAYSGSGMTAAQVMNTLTAATGQGMMTFEQLSGSLANVLPAASKFHISLTDVTAAMATMTAQGDPAANAATHLRQMILSIEAPAKAGAAALKSVGLTSSEVADEMKKSLPDALKMITDAVGKKFPEGSQAYNDAIKNIAGGSKQMMGFLELTGTHLGTFADNVKKISGAVKQGGNDLMGWSDIQQNFNFKLDAATAAVGVLAIKVGTALLPSLGQLLDKVTPLITGFSDWMTKTNAFSGFLGQLGDAFNKVFYPVQQVRKGINDLATAWYDLSPAGVTITTAMRPLNDAFDRANGIVKSTTQTFKPFLDSFDRARGVISDTTKATAPLLDSFDRANGILKDTAGTVHASVNPWTSFFQTMKNVTTAIASVDWGAIFNAIGTGVRDVATAFITIVTVGTSVVQFFQNNQLATAALGVAIGALGGVMALFVASSVADMILSLLSYGSSLLATVAETVTGAAVMTSTFTEMAGIIVGSMGASSVAILSTLGPFLLVGAAVAAVSIGIVLAIQHWGEISQWFSGVWAGVVSDFNSVVGGMNSAIQATMQWWDTWKQPIIAVAESITFFFLPALLIAGTQAVIAGAKIVGSFVASMVMTGITATNNALLVTADFITSMIETGTAAVVSGAKVTASFVASMVVAGWQAVVAGAKITYTFVASLIATGIAGWTAAGGLVPFITGLVSSGVESAVAAASMMSTLVPSLDAIGVAAYAAMGPIGLILGGIALVVTALELMKQKSDEWKTGTTGDFNSAGDMIQRSTGRIMQTADQMKIKVSNDVYTMDTSVSSSMNDMQKKAAQDMETMRNNTITKGAQASTGLENLFNTMLAQVGGDFAQMSSDAYSYLQSVESYVTQAQAKILSTRIGSGGINIINKNFGGYAEGTNYSTAGVHLVGERGPELVVLPRGAQVIPNNQLNSMSSSNSPSHASSNNADRPLILQIDGRTFARVILPALTDQIRYGVGSVGI